MKNLLFLIILLRASRKETKFQKTYKVDLLNGENNFKVVVKNFQKIESRSDYLKIEYNGEIIATSNLYILSVGINKYKNSSYDLNYCQAGCQVIHEKDNRER